MKQKVINIIATALMLGFGQTALASAGATHWGYSGHEGPSHWGELSHDYEACQSGKKQSPINITGAQTANLAKIEFHYQPGALDVVNNGHTIQVNVPAGSYIVADGKKYKLLQFHFHSPSEHEINGKHADMVAHLVHQADDGQLGVIGVLMNKGKANTELARIWAYLPQHKGDHTHEAVKINAAHLLPENTAYYNYSGSLTTPPCSEGVNWLVLQNATSVSQEQVAAFTKIFSNSIRPVQPLNGRVIKSN